MTERSELDAQQIIHRFLTASAPLEAYLQEHGSLTDLQVQSLTVTVKSLQTFLVIWKNKEGWQSDNPFIKPPPD